MLVAQWGVGQALWSMFWFFLFVMWIWLVISIFSDILRSDDLGGVAKAAWLVAILVVPYFGVFIYLIARGNSMGARSLDRARANEDAFRSYVQQAAQTSSPTDELAKLADLHAAGKLTDAEFEQMKARVFSAT